MAGDTRDISRLSFSAEPTSGDFGHTRRRSVRLACCSCTSCCFTFLGGGIGLIGGVIKGVIVGVGHSSSTTENVWLSALESVVRFIGFLIAFAVAGLLMGAAAGGVIDYVWFGLLQ